MQKRVEEVRDLQYTASACIGTSDFRNEDLRMSSGAAYVRVICDISRVTELSLTGPRFLGQVIRNFDQVTQRRPNSQIVK